MPTLIKACLLGKPIPLYCRLMNEHYPQGAPHERLISFVKDRPGHDWRYAIDTSRIQAELGWRPEETFETGIRKTIAWYLKRAKR